MTDRPLLILSQSIKVILSFASRRTDMCVCVCGGGGRARGEGGKEEGREGGSGRVSEGE